MYISIGVITLYSNSIPKKREFCIENIFSDENDLLQNSLPFTDISSFGHCFPSPPHHIFACSNFQVGWRTEFRSLEVQLTDAENAAFISFVVLVTRVVLAFDLNLYIPLSKVGQSASST